MSSLASAGVSAIAGATAALPGPVKSAADCVLPAGLKPARVPITIQMRLGKNDAGGCQVQSQVDGSSLGKAGVTRGFCLQLLAMRISGKHSRG